MIGNRQGSIKPPVPQDIVFDICQSAQVFRIAERIRLGRRQVDIENLHPRQCLSQRVDVLDKRVLGLEERNRIIGNLCLKGKNPKEDR